MQRDAGELRRHRTRQGHAHCSAKTRQATWPAEQPAPDRPQDDSRDALANRTHPHPTGSGSVPASEPERLPSEPKHSSRCLDSQVDDSESHESARGNTHTRRRPEQSVRHAQPPEDD